MPRIVVLFAAGLLLACGPKYDPTLPDSKDLGTVRGLYRFARVITHFHSPYSYDACDYAGLSGGTPNAACVQHIKTAVCKNRVDFLFMSDHPDNMAAHEFNELLLLEPGDQQYLSYANRVGSCEDGFKPVLTVGFESQAFMGLGMTQHLGTGPSDRAGLYIDSTITLRDSLATGPADAIVAIPHTENKETAWINSVNPHAIEIFNIHALIDPKSRKTYLGLAPFSHIPGFLTYLVDPYKTLNPDFGFMNFLEVSELYFSKWNSLLAGALKVAGIGGTDSHENVFPQTASDGERLDAHRRLTRIMSNHVLVTSLDLASVKAAIKNAQSYVVFEGLGTPALMDFYATTNGGGTTVEMGNTGGAIGTGATIYVSLPTLHPQTSKNSELPVISIVLKKVLTGGADQIVATTTGANLQYAVPSSGGAGAYRAEVSIVPKHLRDFLGIFSDNADKEYKWIITNHIYLN